ncbi:hypothetical protein EVAR_17944_1 [Eumeta japonica]|uniref:FLYWCH-type domain-containing protein n=1 Tax=Eumeta variegata TaxID=151549 RepID=A0A4C1UYA7_EUMVA|nr:hypothetical protein EVAR_17944_1 [Eumeta japonica]
MDVQQESQGLSRQHHHLREHRREDLARAQPLSTRQQSVPRSTFGILVVMRLQSDALRDNLKVRTFVPVYGITKAGNRILFIGRHRFLRHSRKPGPKVRWACNKKPRGCRATVITCDDVIIRVMNMHNH